MITLSAVGLAVLAAGCFAVAAAFQHRAAGVAFDGSAEPVATRRLTPCRLLRTVRNRWWLLGLGLAGLGAVLHIGAIALAPVSVVQPVGVLAVPFAVLLGSRLAGTRPSRTVVGAVALCMVGVAAFVALAAGSNDAAKFTDGRLLSAGLVIGGIVITFAVLGARGPHWVRSAGWASAGAVLYGFVSTLMRAVFLMLGDGVPPTDPMLVSVALGIVACFGCGLWLIQQALASGRPEVVVGAQTVLDPAVAVLAGVVLLGEGSHLSAPAVAGLVVAAVVAMAGVFRLARHQAQQQVPSEPPARETAESRWFEDLVHEPQPAHDHRLERSPVGSTSHPGKED